MTNAASIIFTADFFNVSESSAGLEITVDACMSCELLPSGRGVCQKSRVCVPMDVLCVCVGPL